jgi:hypothetical protein
MKINHLQNGFFTENFQKFFKSVKKCQKMPFFTHFFQYVLRRNSMTINAYEGVSKIVSKTPQKPVQYIGHFAKIAIFALFLTISQISFGQKFSGIPIDGNIKNFIESMKLKGYILENFDGRIATFKGKIDNENVRIYVFSSHQTKIVFKLNVFYEKKETFDELKTQMDRIKLVIETKYGASSNCVSNYKYPYEEGDGYELNALILNKLDYVCFWLDIKDNPNFNISLELTSFQKVLLTYENVANTDIAIKEKNKIDSETY